MVRTRNTDVNNLQFGGSFIKTVWQKGRIISNYNPSKWRYDVYGTPIMFNEYGNTYSIYGWEIDHIMPIAKGGTDVLTNLQ